MNTKDPQGYYATLELSPSASAAEIKAAYRRRAMELHPDRNTSSNATKEFQFLNEAYGVLSEPSARAQYDTISVETTSRRAAEQQTPPDPIVCSVCAKVSAQPRYAIFYEVKSFIFMTRRTPIQGIFCSGCAERKCLRATAITWMFGWWGFPWGLIYSPQAIFANLRGGERPPNANARLAAHQAMAFAILGKIELARAIALDALDLARKIKPDKISAKLKKALGYDVDDEAARLSKEIGDLLAALGNEGRAIRLKNSWSILRRPFYVQGFTCLAAIALISSAILSNTPGP